MKILHKITGETLFELEGGFVGGNLVGANLGGANLGWANLRGANMGGANLHLAELSRAKYDKDTELPKGLDPEKRGMVLVKGE